MANTKKTPVEAERLRICTVLGVPQLARKPKRGEAAEPVPPAIALSVGLIDQAARLRVMLDELAADLEKNSCTDMYQRSSRSAPEERERPCSDVYNKKLDRYQSIIRQLCALLPEEQGNEAVDQLLQFTSRQR